MGATAPCMLVSLLALGAVLSVCSAKALDPELEEAIRNRDPEEEARAYLRDLDQRMGEWNNKMVLAEWGYVSNITDESLKHKLEVNAAMAAFQKNSWHETIRFDWKNFKDPELRRQFKKYSILGTSALPPEKIEKIEVLVSEMESTYSKAKICDYFNQTNCHLSLEPEIVELMQRSRDPQELRHAWVEWRRASGEKVRGQFERYVALSNEAALLNNFTDTSEMWLEPYEADDFRDQVRDLWQQLRPLYEQLHAYVRRRLRDVYGPDEVTADGPIPAHLVGEMWSSTWNNVANFSVPVSGLSPPDVSEAMKEQEYTPLRIFKLSEEFFTSLGLSAMPELFWQNSILEKPTDRVIVCHASAWDFYDGKDFRVKQCTRANMKHLSTAHHEMGHVQYYLQYKHLPIAFRRGANPGFHEAVGDVMALSVSTPKHLRKIGLLREDSGNDEGSDLNYLYLQALQKVAFLPYSYLMDLWRWDVFSGKTTSDDYNCKWWRLREQYQGIEAPVDRSEDDFDPGAKYHIVASVPYIRYFVSNVIQFQFHRALCLEAGEYDPKDPSKPLHSCDIYGSKAAGDKLKAMLQMGSSRPWPEALEAVTGSKRMDASGLLDYFRPLHQWLEEHNSKSGERVGWGPSRRVCVSSREELEKSSKRASVSANEEKPAGSENRQAEAVSTAKGVSDASESSSSESE